MTIDDQIAALEPLPVGTIARLAGFAAPGSISTKRHRGRSLTAEQLLAAAAGLRSLADKAEALARSAPATERRTPKDKAT